MPDLPSPPACKCCDSGAPHLFQLVPPPKTPCLHPVEVCSDCWEGWIEQQLTSRAPSRLSCVQCENILGEAEVRAFASAETHQRWVRMARIQFMVADTIQVSRPRAQRDPVEHRGVSFLHQARLHLRPNYGGGRSGLRLRSVRYRAMYLMQDHVAPGYQL